MTPSSPPSPAWLGFGAAFSFVGLAIAAFASGHHLVDRQGAAGPHAVGSDAVVVASAVVKGGKDAEGTPLRAAPDSPSVIGRLPARQRVDVLSQQGPWARVRTEIDGKAVEGWIEQTHLSSP
jgi:hypothetical protein